VVLSRFAYQFIARVRFFELAFPQIEGPQITQSISHLHLRIVLVLPAENKDLSVEIAAGMAVPLEGLARLDLNCLPLGCFDIDFVDVIHALLAESPKHKDFLPAVYHLRTDPCGREVDVYFHVPESYQGAKVLGRQQSCRGITQLVNNHFFLILFHFRGFFLQVLLLLIGHHPALSPCS